METKIAVFFHRPHQISISPIISTTYVFSPLLNPAKTRGGGGSFRQWTCRNFECTPHRECNRKKQSRPPPSRSDRALKANQGLSLPLVPSLSARILRYRTSVRLVNLDFTAVSKANSKAGTPYLNCHATHPEYVRNGRQTSRTCHHHHRSRHEPHA